MKEDTRTVRYCSDFRDGAFMTRMCCISNPEDIFCFRGFFMHKRFMRQALTLAQKGAGLVHPNPLVGSILVNNGTVIGKGFHERCGGPHAEVKAIADARSQGHTDFSECILYVTLEPCCHFGKTPPCTDLIVRAGIRTVVIGMTDPNPLVSGRGTAALRNAGITVIAGILESECRNQNRIFGKYIATHLPFILFKSAVSLDGKIATAGGDSRWISCEESRRDGHRLRNEYTAIMCGINTVIADDPQLDVRLVRGTNPIRIIVDSTLRIPIDSRIVRTAHSIPTIIAMAENLTEGRNPALAEKGAALTDAGIQILRIREAGGHVDLAALTAKLGAMEIDSVLLEGGGTLAAAALRYGIVDRVCLYMAPLLIGGQNAMGFIGGEGPPKLADCLKLKNVSVGRSGCDIVVKGDICSPE